MVGARRIVTGRLVANNGQYNLTLELIRADNGRVLKTLTDEYDSLEFLAADCQELTDRLLGRPK